MRIDHTGYSDDEPVDNSEMTGDADLGLPDSVTATGHETLRATAKESASADAEKPADEDGRAL